jgi:hypothetical protein
VTSTTRAGWSDGEAWAGLARQLDVGPNDFSHLLAASLSPLPYVTYAALRRTRRMLLPPATLRVEVDLCRSSLVGAVAADGFTLTHGFRRRALDAMREANDSDQSEDVLAKVGVARAHAATSLSPLLAIESALAWDYVELRGAAFEEAVDAKLRDVLLTSILEQRHGLLDWFAAARLRLPDECVRQQTAWILSQLCMERGLDIQPIPFPSTFTPTGLVALVADKLPRSVVGIDRRRGSIEFGPPSAERSVGLSLVDTDPMIVYLEEIGRRSDTREIRLESRAPFRVDCGDGAIVLTNLAGQRFTMSALVGEHADESFRGDRAVGAAQAAKTVKKTTSATVIREVFAGYVVAMSEFGGTAFLYPRGRIFHTGEELQVRVVSVDAERRWIGVEPATREAVSRTPGEGIAVLPRSALPPGALVGDFAAAVVIKHGIVRAGNVRSAHVFLDPRSPLGHISYSHRVGHVRFEGAVQFKDGQWVPAVGAEAEVVLADMGKSAIELRLRPAPADEILAPVAQPARKGDIVEAVVLQVDHEGAELETMGLQPAWLPCENVFPPIAYGDALPLRIGQEVLVKLVAWVRHGERYLATQYGIREPFIDRLQSDQEVLGVVRYADDDGSWRVELEPIARVSKKPFIVRIRTQDGHAVLNRGGAFSATVSGVDVRRSIIRVKDVRPQ